MDSDVQSHAFVRSYSPFKPPLRTSFVQIFYMFVPIAHLSRTSQIALLKQAGRIEAPVDGRCSCRGYGLVLRPCHC
jgi:hypothetical protein